ncbi:hypothetical protein ACFY0G_45430 [Streptomyces sp. NPDC001552]|uniref:effector-associated constant component EACC1 n=1 Tax=Streptomyces sp. NPDC001552 TaxID=3364587 RepID=UPI0036939732
MVAIKMLLSDLYAIAGHMKQQPGGQADALLEMLLYELDAVAQDVEQYGGSPDLVDALKQVPVQVEVSLVRQVLASLESTADSLDPEDEADRKMLRLIHQLSHEVWIADGAPIDIDLGVLREAVLLLDLAVRSGSPEAPRGLTLLSPLVPNNGDAYAAQDVAQQARGRVPAEVVEEISSILRHCMNEFGISGVEHQATETITALDCAHLVAMGPSRRIVLAEGAVFAATATAAVTPLARVLLVWLRQRKSDVKLEITRSDGATVSVEATHLAEPEEMLERLAQVLDRMPPGPALLPAAVPLPDSASPQPQVAEDEE